ncbi:Serine/threonine-protein phosphatase 7 long form-like [Vitis vinifera]|uniref:Serine/threonine-protein phosphatase 7 long form-like n=1 Tax=Vitis vinifera TaxID=29760 RepID=A0A438EF06_VITVI|nr:Serine/threonine-protein phosphatase 7 long form-like [Vitis vinifera]
MLGLEREHFSSLPPDADVESVRCYARAFILQLIGGFLFADKSNNRVHLMFLPLLKDLGVIGIYSWGSACLAWLYREMYRASHIDAHDVSGPLVLLQLWIWDRFPFIAPMRLHSALHDGVLPQPPLGMQMSIHHHYIQRWEARYNHLAKVEAAYTSYGLDTPNIGHRDEIHQLCATTLEAIHEADRLLIPPNIVDIERQSSDDEVVMRDGGVQTRGDGVQTRDGMVPTRGGGVRTRGLKIHKADKLLIPPNVVDIERQSSNEEVGMRDGRVRTRSGGVRTRGGGVRTRGGGVRTRGCYIFYDLHFPIDDALLDFPSSSSLQHSAFTFSTPLDQSLPYSSVPSIDEGVIQEDVGTSFIQELLHYYIDGPSFHIPMSSSIDVSFTPPSTPLIALLPQSLGHSFRDDTTTQMQYFPTPLDEQQGEAQVQDQGCGRGKGRGRG